jgi:adenine deaminase
MAVFINKQNPYVSPTTFHFKEENYFGLSVPYSVAGNIVDIINQRIFRGRIYVNVLGDIEKVEECDVSEDHFILPGFVDSHVHIESSMLMPAEFACGAVKHGVVATVSDPHEIANVLDVDGVKYFIENGKKSGFKFFFGAPSCVPAVDFEISGARIGPDEIKILMKNNDIWFLGEMMNFPGVVQNNPEILAKIKAAKESGKPVDGHAPKLSGEDLLKYVSAGISTDHECMDICEAEEKLAAGMKILIREGSAAKNFEALYPLINQYPSSVMLCTDDSHPDDLLEGYIDKLISRGLSKGLDFFNLMKAAVLNPVTHYKLPVGLLRPADSADFIIIDHLKHDFNILQTYISGRLVYDRVGEEVNIHRPKIEIKNNFHAASISEKDIEILATGDSIHVIEVVDKELYTKNLIERATVTDGKLVSSSEKDILKIVVINRYEKNAKPSVGFIKGFGLKRGAICGTIAHDNHNIIAVGVDDASIVKAVNAVVAESGGIAVCDDESLQIIPLPIAGIISTKTLDEIAESYKKLQISAKDLGCVLTSPFMTLSFMALIVIPDLKICDKGLFDVTKFQHIELFN